MWEMCIVKNSTGRRVQEEDTAEDGWFQRDDLRRQDNLQVEILQLKFHPALLSGNVSLRY